jgi:hypothetical protein
MKGAMMPAPIEPVCTENLNPDVVVMKSAKLQPTHADVDWNAGTNHASANSLPGPATINLQARRPADRRSNGNHDDQEAELF